jgi:hypothetical protein
VTTDLEVRVRSLFTKLADATPVEPDATFTPRRGVHVQLAPKQPIRSRLMIAVSMVLVLGAAAALVVRHAEGPSGEPTPSTSAPPSDSPSGLWLPQTIDGALRIVGYAHHEGSPTAQGAVVAPDGTVFGLSANAPSASTAPPQERRRIGAFDVEAVADGTSPAEIYRSIIDDCVAVDITTADEEMWSADTVTLINGLTISGSTVHFDLPAGWTTLGANAWKVQYQATIESTTAGTTHELTLVQMPGATLGFYLDAMESPPKEVTVGGQRGWLIAGVTTPGYNTLVALRGSTPFSLAGEVPGDELVRIAESMTPADATAWTQQTNQQQPPATPASVAPSCARPTIQIAG